MHHVTLKNSAKLFSGEKDSEREGVSHEQEIASDLIEFMQGVFAHRKVDDTLILLRLLS